MYKNLILLLLVVSLSSLVAAQNNDKKVEFFGGYTYTVIDDRKSGSPIDHVGTLEGFNVAVTGYMSKRFGITGDFSAGFRTGTESVTGGSIRYKSTNLSFMAGPHLRFVNKTRSTPFIHALAGSSTNRFAYSLTPTGSSSVSARVTQTATDFSMAFGGGLDIRLNNKISVRAFQLDYNPVFVKNRPQFGPNSGGGFDNVRFSMGFVFK